MFHCFFQEGFKGIMDNFKGFQECIRGVSSKFHVFLGCLNDVLFLTVCFEEVTRCSKELLRVFQGNFVSMVFQG